MGKNKNFTIQLNNRINDLLGIGVSKFDAKKDYQKIEEEHGRKANPSKSNYIHNPNSANAYRQTVGEVCKWLKENKTDIWSSKDLNQIDKSVAYEYLKYREESCSAYTVSKDMSALNKVLNLDLNKEEGGLHERSYKDVTRSREPRGMDKSYNPKNYSNQIEFAKAFGVRRESMLGGNYQVKDVSLFTRENRVYCSVIEKGGRYREAPCLDKYQDSIQEKYNIVREMPSLREDQETSFTKEIFKHRYAESGEVLWDKYTTKIDNHAFRGQYARDLYNQIAEQKEDVKNNYRGYDKEIVEEVSHALGHNRLSVVVEHYLR